MQVLGTEAVTGAGSSAVLTAKNASPFNIGFGVALSGTVTDYSVQATHDGTNFVDHGTVTGLGVEAEGAYTSPIVGLRVTITTGTGTATLTAIQE